VGDFDHLHKQDLDFVQAFLFSWRVQALAAVVTAHA